MRIRELHVAEQAAVAAGNAVMRLYGTATSWEKSGGSPVTAADLASNEVIQKYLRREFPHDPILSEESRDDDRRLGASRVWIVDPLDGTKEFLAGNGEFSIMIGLAGMDGPRVGVVYQPTHDLLFSAALGHGSWVRRGGEQRRLRCTPSHPSRIRMIGSRSHPDPVFAAIRDRLQVRDVEPCGSVGLKCARIAEGHRDLYVHPVPYLREWDTCAAEILLREAGGSVRDCDGNPLQYNKPDPVQSRGIVACAPGLLHQALAVVRPLFAEAHRAAECA